MLDADSRSTMATPPPPALTNDDLVGALSDDLLEEFLRRLPPDDPASLVRASMVCKQWRRILADPGFRRRLCDHHRVLAPPMLGFFGRKYEHARKGTRPAFFTPTSSFRPRTAALSLGWFRYVIHACHGRVLLAGLGGGARLDPMTGLLEQQPSSRCFAVWDPITGDLLELPRLQPWQATDAYFSWNAVVLCGGGSANNCDHLDCHRRGPFIVVFVGTSAVGIYSYVYSSQAGTWSHTCSVAREAADLVSTRLYRDGFDCNIVAGNTVFFRLMSNIRVLKYDLSTEEISSVDLPAQCRSVCSEIFLTTTKSGEFGVAGVDSNLWILLWSREASPDGHFRWTPPSRVIDLSTVPHANNFYPYRVVGILHSLGVIIVWGRDGVFSVDIESYRMTKLCVGHLSYYVPYMSFCMPEEGPSAGVSKCKMKKNKDKKVKFKFLVQE